MLKGNLLSPGEILRGSLGNAEGMLAKGKIPFALSLGALRTLQWLARLQPPSFMWQWACDAGSSISKMPSSRS